MNLTQTCFTQGFAPALRERCARFEASAPALWAEASATASSQPILSLATPKNLTKWQEQVALWRRHSDQLVVIGTGRASLGGQALSSVAPHAASVSYMEACDSEGVAALFASINPLRTHWLIISKSGETLETLALSLSVLAHYEAQGLADALPRRVTVMTCRGDRSLRRLAEIQGWELQEHPPQISGRFSCFSAVGLLPLAFAGGALVPVMEAVRSVWSGYWQTQDVGLLHGAIAFAASLPEKPIHVVMAYADGLRSYRRWYEQIWAESLGKQGRGATPVAVTGAVAQHSQLQLYLDGPSDKMFTILFPEDAMPALPLARVPHEGMGILGSKTLKDVMRAMATATYETLRAHQAPVRMMGFALTPEGVGSLMARTMAEALLVATLLGVNPFDQPAVEECKQRTRALLGV